MNKLKILQKMLIKKAIIAAIVIAICAGIYVAIDSIDSGYIQQKSEMEAGLGMATNDRNQLQSKIEGANTSEKNYTNLLLAHPNAEFEAKREALVEFLNRAKVHYRFSAFKVSLTPEGILSDTAFTSPEGEITIRDNMQIELSAISDMHVFSFLSELLTKAPGFIHLKSLTIERKNDMSNAMLDQLQNGNLVEGVSAKIIVSWVGVRVKEVAPADTSANPKTGGQP